MSRKIYGLTRIAMLEQRTRDSRDEQDSICPE